MQHYGVATPMLFVDLTYCIVSNLNFLRKY